jgi:hypothetical protein
MQAINKLNIHDVVRERKKYFGSNRKLSLTLRDRSRDKCAMMMN